MRNIIIYLIIVKLNILLSFNVFAQNKKTFTKRQLKREVRKIIRKSMYKGRTGIYAKFLKGKKIVSFNPKIPMTPASCTKILTTSAVLRNMGLQYKFKSVFYGNYEKDTMTTPLYWWSNGDPSMDLKDLSDMISKLKSMGIRKIPKGVVIDDYFFIRAKPLGFKISRGFEGYLAAPSPVTVNTNSITVTLKRNGNNIDIDCYPPSELLECISKVKNGRRNYDLRVYSSIRKGKIRVTAFGRLGLKTNKYSMRARSIRRAMFSAGVLLKELRAHGIVVPVKYKRRRIPKNIKTLAVHFSKPLINLVNLTNKYSNNFYAENLLRSLGAYKFGVPGTTTKGLKAVYGLLGRAGVNKRYFNISNGSGLFGRTVVSPYHMVRVMEHISSLPWLYNAIVNSLAEPGQDGTLHGRFLNTPAQYILHAKTGTLNNASCLSGYLTHNSKTVIFSVINDKFKGQLLNARRLQDKIIILLSKIARGRITLK